MASPANATPSFDPPVQPLLRRASQEQAKRLMDVAAATSGEFVSKTGDESAGAIRLTFRYAYPLPPRFHRFVEEAATMSAMLRLFPYGIPAPDGILVQVYLGRIAD
jgi:hypothetical protein